MGRFLHDRLHRSQFLSRRHLVATRDCCESRREACCTTTSTSHAQGSEPVVTWRIIKQGWEHADALFDTRIDTIFGYEELNGAKYVTSNDLGEVFFVLVDDRVASLVSTDVEQVEPLHDQYLREPWTDDDYFYRYSVWWCAAGCLPDFDHPAFSADTLEEIDAWLQSDEADEYRSAEGEFSTYSFEITDNTTTQKAEQQ